MNDRPLLDTALRALEHEASGNPDAAVVWEIIRELPIWSQLWAMLDVLTHFDGCVKSRPALVSVLLRELSAAHPVPKSLLH
jgi:hypothetical protein